MKEGKKTNIVLLLNSMPLGKNRKKHRPKINYPTVRATGRSIRKKKENRRPRGSQDAKAAK